MTIEVSSIVKHDKTSTEDVFVIGDVQGCFDELQLLLQKIETQSKHYRLIFAGDIINRGPKSLECLRFIRELGARAQIVLGNHDLHLLAVAHGIRAPHRSDTLDAILGAKDKDELLDWLRQQPLAIFDTCHLIVHAGVFPEWTTRDVLDLSDEVQSFLRGPNYVEFLQEMYGNTPDHWSPTWQGIERLRCIVNAFTRMRFCTADGSMDFSNKDGTLPAPEGLHAWFDLTARKTQETPIVFGHWSTLGLIVRDNLVSLDTGCVWGGKLSAVSLRTHQIIQIDCPMQQKPGKGA